MCQVLETRCDYLEKRMRAYDQEQKGYARFQSRDQREVLLPKRKRAYKTAQDQYFAELEASVQLLETHNIKPTRKHLRELGYGCAIVDRFAQQKS